MLYPEVELTFYSIKVIIRLLRFLYIITGLNKYAKVIYPTAIIWSETDTNKRILLK